MDPSSETKAEGLVLAAGGVEVEIEYRETGQKEFVKVAQLPVRSMERYLRVFDDEEKAIELFCGKQDGWAALLTAASHNELIEKGQEINFPLFEGWYRRRMARAELLSPGVNAKIMDLMGDVARSAIESTSPSSSPASPVAPATPASN